MMVLHHVSEDFKICGAAGYIEMRGKADWLAGIGNFGLEEVIKTRLNAAYNRCHELQPLCQRHDAPWALERSLGGFNGIIDIDLICLMNYRQKRAVYRADIVECFA